jgi:hypothetical protein
MNVVSLQQRMGHVALKEADTRCILISPQVQPVAWENELHSKTEQRTFIDGWLFVPGNQFIGKFHLLCL